MSVMTDSPESGRLYRLGRACARRPWWVVAFWLVALLGVGLGNRQFGGEYSDDFSLPDSPAQQGAQVLAEHSTDSSAFAGQIVVHSTAGTIDTADRQAALTAGLSAVGQIDHVLSVGSPTVSGDRRDALVSVSFDVNPVSLGPEYVARIDQALTALQDGGQVEVDYGGQLGEAARERSGERTSEIVGVVTALLVLLGGFGSVCAGLLPVVAAAVGVGVGLSLLGIVAATTSFAAVSPTLAVMMGLGVGIDYALFLTTRFRGHLYEGLSPQAAAGRTVSTSGRAVLTAALTVVVAMLGLYASGLSFIGRLGLAASITVAVAGLGAVTLVPALLGLAGRRIDVLRVRRPVAEGSGERDVWHRYARRVGRHPWRYLSAGVAVLAVLAAPTAAMTLGHVDAGAQPESSTARVAYDRIADGFSAGANGPLTVVVELAAPPDGSADPDADLVRRLSAALAGTEGVASVGPLRSTPDAALLSAVLVPSTGPQDPATDDLLNRLRTRTLPQALAGSGARGYVTGATAFQLDFRDRIAQRLPVIIAVVIMAAVVLLLISFRSPVLALKAAVLNLLSIGAAYGVVVAVFQWGWGSSLLGVGAPVPIESYVPMMMFAIVFGLSMDYEVFLLSRVREAWLISHDNHTSVGTGLAVTARVISCAAIVMTSVFAAFLSNDNVVIKMLALGLAVSVLIDATVIRLVVVPATMFLLGSLNWWIPAWLDRILPRLEAPEPGDAPHAEEATEVVTGPVGG